MTTTPTDSEIYPACSKPVTATELLTLSESEAVEELQKLTETELLTLSLSDSEAVEEVQKLTATELRTLLESEAVEEVQKLLQQKKATDSEIYPACSQQVTELLTLSEAVEELQKLLPQKRATIKDQIHLMMQDKMCIHCSRVYFYEFLSPRELLPYDACWSEDFCCSCDD